MNTQNCAEKPKKIRSQSREGQKQLVQPRIAFQNATLYRNITADKHKKHSVDKKKNGKSKIKKNKIKNQIDNLEEERLLQQEQERLKQLEEFQKQQWKKMSADERERLSKEQQLNKDSNYEWDRQFNEALIQKQKQEEWNNYIGLQEYDVRIPRDLNTIIYKCENIDLDNLNINDKQAVLLRQTEFLAKLQFKLQVAQLEDISLSLTNINHYNMYINICKNLKAKKLQLLSKSYLQNYECYLEELNNILKSQFFLLEFTPETQQRIVQKLAQKPEDRTKYEILKQSSCQTLSLGFWYCPLSKMGYRIKPVEFPQVSQLSIEIPRQLSGQSLIYQVQWQKEDEQNIYQQYLGIGGKFSAFCHNLPKLSKKRNGWQLVQIPSDSQLEPIKLNQGVQSCGVYFQISNQFFLWDASKLFIVTYQQQQWTQDNVDDIKINIANRSVSFQLKLQIPFMLATYRFIDFPFISWNITSQGKEKLHLDIVTARNIQITIELTSEGSSVLQPNIPIQQNISIVELLLQLRSIGINLMAQQEDAICLKTKFKMQEVEDQVLLNMMQALKIYSFRNSKTNNLTSEGSIVLEFIENPLMIKNFNGDDEFCWRTLEFQLNKVALVEIPSLKWVKNTVSHSNLYILLEQHQLTPPELLIQIEEIQDAYFRGIFRTMMKTMHLLSIN